MTYAEARALITALHEAEGDLVSPLLEVEDWPLVLAEEAAERVKEQLGLLEVMDALDEATAAATLNRGAEFPAQVSMGIFIGRLMADDVEFEERVRAAIAGAS